MRRTIVAAFALSARNEVAEGVAPRYGFKVN
jgi:hypothetical protein